MNANDVIKLAQENDVKFVDLTFGDLFGALQHFTIPVARLEEELFEDGMPFDGSSIRGWKSIDKSDMIMMPDPESAYIDPFRDLPVLTMFCSIIEPRTMEPYERDPRSIAGNSINFLKSTGLGDQAYFGPEPEYFIFDSVQHASNPESSFYVINSEEGAWTTGDEDSSGRAIPFKGGYAPASPADTLFDFRNEVSMHLATMGVEVELHHHEVGTAGQCEHGTKFDSIIKSADQVHKLKYAIKNTAPLYGKTATFMPKPLFGDNGSGMHIHSSIWKDGKNIFAGDVYADLSQEAIWAIGGVLKHARSLQAFINPTVNSYRRLVPGYEAPVLLAYSATNRSASVRIPHVKGDAARRFEFRCPDSSGSPYLAFAAMLMAQIDGIKNQIDPGEPMDKNLYDLPAEEIAQIPSTCQSLEEALEALKEDREYLLQGGVFSDELLDSYTAFKMENEVIPNKLRPNPLEFGLYFDC
jgi:glutamine synthetase type I